MQSTLRRADPCKPNLNLVSLPHLSPSQPELCHDGHLDPATMLLKVAKQGNPPALPEVDILHVARIVATYVHAVCPHAPGGRSSVTYRAH